MSVPMHPIRADALSRRDELLLRHPTLVLPPLGPRVRAASVVVLGLGVLMFGLWHLGFSPARMLAGLGQLGTFLTYMVPPSFGLSATTEAAARLWFGCLLSVGDATCADRGTAWTEMWRGAPFIWFHALAETVAIAFLGTFTAAVLALPLGLLAARNVMANRVVRFLSRRMLDTVRGVDELIWALIWINVVGLGPFAGVLAIATAFVGAFGKLYSEAIEACDRKASEGVLSTGGSGVHRLRFGLLPEVFPVIASQVLYFFESNTRSATIIGIVGAGGIGLHLSEQIRTLEWQNVSFLILMILATVALIDAVSTRIRFAVIGTKAPAEM